MAGEEISVLPCPNERKCHAIECTHPDAGFVAIRIVYYLDRLLFSDCQSNGTHFNRQRAVTNNNDVAVVKGRLDTRCRSRIIDFISIGHEG